MNLNNMNFPRQLEAAGLAEKIREALAVRQARIQAEGTMEVPVLTVGKTLVDALLRARMQRRVRYGFDDIFDKLASEKKGIDELLQKTKSPQQDRISRLLLFSNDCVERLYRHIEQTLTEHQLRILGCRLDIDSKSLGQLITGRSSAIKVILVEHKDAVSDVLRTVLSDSK